MSLEHSPARTTAGSGHNGGPVLDDDTEPTSDDSLWFWYGLINESIMAEFLNVTVRSLQKWRRTGDGPQYVRISANCIKYRRIDGREFSEARLRKSTSDPGTAA